MEMRPVHFMWAALLVSTCDGVPEAGRSFLKRGRRPLLRVRDDAISATSDAQSFRDGIWASEPLPDVLAKRNEKQGAKRRARVEDEKAVEQRRLLRGRVTVLACLFLFTFFNGMARRSLSSAGPSLVAEGLITEDRAEEVFALGFDAFAFGKLLVLPTLILLGAKAALLLQVGVVTAGSAALWLAAGVPRVQEQAWIWIRIFSAMATSTTLPFVGSWFPRAAYGRAFGWIFTGFQAGYFFVSVYWQRLLFSSKGLHWRLPFATCTLIGLSLFVSCATLLDERPAPRSAASPSPSGKATVVPTDAESRRGRWTQMVQLLAKMRTRLVFWGMVVTVFAYTPIVEYSTHVTSYLKEMASDARPIRDGFVCLASNLCESRYRGYVMSYVSSLLLGSVFYDRATQLDRALLVLGLYSINIGCWALLALSEPSQVPLLTQRQPSGPASLVSLVHSFFAREEPAAEASVHRVVLPLEGWMKTALASIAGATIALPSCLPFAIFALDFGKEGAALLSAVLGAVAMVSAFVFLRMFPIVRLRHGWFGVHTCMAAAGCVAAVANGAVMLSDYRKFSRGYIIESSLANETVVTLHACSRPGCSSFPMWRPGARRVWSVSSGRGIGRFRAHVPNRYCHNCGNAELLECKVANSASEAALFTPFHQCSEWIREKAPLRKPKGGWAFSDPLRFPLAPEATYGDKRAYTRRLDRNEEESKNSAQRSRGEADGGAGA